MPLSYPALCLRGVLGRCRTRIGSEVPYMSTNYIIIAFEMGGHSQEDSLISSGFFYICQMSASRITRNGASNRANLVDKWIITRSLFPFFLSFFLSSRRFLRHRNLNPSREECSIQQVFGTVEEPLKMLFPLSDVFNNAYDIWIWSSDTSQLHRSEFWAPC